jgi:hypothetical protein
MAEEKRSSLRLTVTDRMSQAEADRAAWRSLTPEERLDAVEDLRLQAGRFLHEYPARLRRLLTVARRPSENLRRLQAALVDFGFGADTVPIETLGRPDAVLAIGIEPVRIDLLNRIAGVAFDEARANVVRGRYGAVDVAFIGKDDLLRNKRATGRQRDLGDVEELL